MKKVKYSKTEDKPTVVQKQFESKIILRELSPLCCGPDQNYLHF